jgi:hypothetical protein
MANQNGALPWLQWSLSLLLLTPSSLILQPSVRLAWCTFLPIPFTLPYQMRFLAIFGASVLLAGQGMAHEVRAASTRCFSPYIVTPVAALALNITVGGSVGTVSADSFLTVQDNDLNTQVRYTELPDVLSG